MGSILSKYSWKGAGTRQPFLTFSRLHVIHSLKAETAGAPYLNTLNENVISLARVFTERKISLLHCGIASRSEKVIVWKLYIFSNPRRTSFVIETV